MVLFDHHKVGDLSLLLRKFYKNESIEGLKVDPEILLALPDIIQDEIIPKCIESGLINQEALDTARGRILFVYKPPEDEDSILQYLDIYIRSQAFITRVSILDLVYFEIQKGRFRVARAIIDREKITRPDVSLLNKVAKTKIGNRQDALNFAKYLVEELKTPLKATIIDCLGDDVDFDVKEEAKYSLAIDDPVRFYLCSL
jgi:hypothetical protein